MKDVKESERFCNKFKMPLACYGRARLLILCQKLSSSRRCMGPQRLLEEDFVSKNIEH